jgi:hypothetical protein
MLRAKKRFDYQGRFDYETGDMFYTIYLREHTSRIGTDLPIPGAFISLPGYRTLQWPQTLALLNRYFDSGCHLQPWERGDYGV